MITFGANIVGCLWESWHHFIMQCNWELYAFGILWLPTYLVHYVAANIGSVDVYNESFSCMCCVGVLVLYDASSYRVLFCSSVLNLCELVALRPDLATLHKIVYFHENQLVYPVRKQQERDFQYGYNQILSWYGMLNHYCVRKEHQCTL